MKDVIDKATGQIIRKAPDPKDALRMFLRMLLVELERQDVQMTPNMAHFEQTTTVPSRVTRATLDIHFVEKRA